MEKQELTILGEKCLELVQEALKKKYDGEKLEFFMAFLLPHQILLRTAELLAETYKGIIGYHNWLVAENIEPDSFVQDAIHDLMEAVKHRPEDDGYCPRTSQYVKFHKE